MLKSKNWNNEIQIDKGKTTKVTNQMIGGVDYPRDFLLGTRL